MFTSTAAELYHFDLAELTPVAALIGPPIPLVHTPLPTTERPRARGSAFWSPNVMQQALDNHLSVP
jgi:hypothetical protein